MLESVDTIVRKLTILIVFLNIFLLLGCQTETQTEKIKLDTPTNVIFDGVVRWDSVEHAQSYLVYLNETSYEVNDNFYIFQTEGVFNVSVVATGDGYLDSEASVKIIVTIDYDNDIEFDFQIEESILSWTNATDAIGYNLFINGVKYEITLNTFNINQLDAGVQRIAVQAIYPVGVSKVSYIYTYLHNITIKDILKFQYSIYSTDDLITRKNFTGPLYVIDASGDFINTDSVLVFVNENYAIRSSFIKSQVIEKDNLPFEFYLVSGQTKTKIEIMITEVTTPYIMSSTVINTDGEEDVLLQFELFGGVLFSINGTKTDVVLYEVDENILTIKAEFISQKFVQSSTFALSYVININENSVIGYLDFNKIV